MSEIKSKVSAFVEEFYLYSIITVLLCFGLCFALIIKFLKFPKDSLPSSSNDNQSDEFHTPSPSSSSSPSPSSSGSGGSSNDSTRARRGSSTASLPTTREPADPSLPPLPDSPPRPPPIPIHELVASLPVREYNNKSQSNNSTQCEICHDEYQQGNVIKRLWCNHEFHRECVDEWLKNWSRDRPNCPKCRSDIYSMSVPSPSEPSTVDDYDCGYDCDNEHEESESEFVPDEETYFDCNIEFSEFVQHEEGLSRSLFMSEN